jgi:hypothetical protein
MAVGEIQKNALEKIIVSTGTYKGYDFVDVRVYYQDKDGEWKPTRKGVAVPPDKLEELIDLLKRAQTEIAPTAKTD